MIAFLIDVEDANGNKLGGGPITSAANWTYTARMDRAGSFSFAMPASDSQATLIQKKRRVRAWALLNSTWTEVGAGIIDQIDRSPGADGTTTLVVAGDDEIRELTQRSVGVLELASGGAITHSAALTAIAGAVATGWTFTPAVTPGNDAIYGQFAGETLLQALIVLGEKTQTHFYRSAPRTITFATAWTASGVRAIQASATLAPETCAIVSLRQQVDSYDLLTRIVPLGSGNGQARLTLAATTRSAPTGYTLNAAANYLQNDAAVATYGVVDAPWIEFKDVRPVSNTTADVQAAADMLFDLALMELRRRSVDIELATYTLELAECSRLLRPMQSLRLVYRNLAAGLDVDEDLNILEATWSVDASGVRTTGLKVTNADRWPASDVDTLVGRIAEGSIYQAHPQLNDNDYVIAYTKNLDEEQSNPAEFRFRFDDQVTQLVRVAYDFKLLPLESTVKTVASNTPTSAASGDHTHSVTISDHTHSVTISNHTHSVTISDHTHSVTIASHTHDVTIDNHTHTVSISSHRHDVPLEADADPTGNHPFARIVYYDPTDDNFYFQAASGSGYVVGSSSDGSSTPTSSNGGGQTKTSTSGGGSTVTSGNGGGTTATSSNGGGSTVTSGSGGGTTATSASGGSHTHTVTPALTTTYGVYRDISANVFALADLEYSLDGATWYGFAVGINGYANLGDGWNRVDLTALLQDSTTLRPLASNNLLLIRRKSTGATGKKCTIDAQMSVRTRIQAIAAT